MELKQYRVWWHLPHHNHDMNLGPFSFFRNLQPENIMLSQITILDHMYHVIKSYYCSWCFMYPLCFWYRSVPSWTFNCPLQPWWLTYFLNLILRVSRFFSGQSRSSNSLLNKSLLKILYKLSQWVHILWDCQCFLNEIFGLNLSFCHHMQGHTSSFKLVTSALHQIVVQIEFGNGSFVDLCRFLSGFLLPILWYYGAFLFFTSNYHNDPRERPALVACSIAVCSCTPAPLPLCTHLCFCRMLHGFAKHSL